VSRRLEILEEMGLAPVWRLRETRPPVSAESAETGGSREERIARMDWPQLKATVAGCTACALRAGCTQTVFGVGDEKANWLLVGEAPGAEEDRQGEPFVGQAGRLLDSMLASLGLARQENVYIANVLKCRPPGNRNPEPAEVAACAPHLTRQIELIRPKLILAMGRFAVQTLLNTDATIGSLRGSVHRYQGVPLVVTYHPAYLLRNLPDKAKAWADLVLAKKTIAEVHNP
jgi:DNA polymerase